MKQNTIRNFIGQKISKVVCYQWSYDDEDGPSLADQKHFLYCDPVILYFDSGQSLYLQSVETCTSDGKFMFTLWWSPLQELDFAWEDAQATLIRNPSVKETELSYYRNCRIRAIGLHKIDRHEDTIQSMRLKFECGQSLYIFTGDGLRDEAQKMKLHTGDEYLLVFTEESHLRRYGFTHQDRHGESAFDVTGPND
jgi:hypothetical protein